MKKRDWLYVFIITVITALALYVLPLIPNFFKEKEAEVAGFVFVIVFLLFDLIFIGIPAWIHWAYVKDYSKIKNIWFFALFGGITGALLGERSIVMIIPYTILMLIYAFLYKKFPWWKVALTSYLGGIIVENIINRSPIQLPTLMWIAFFTYPYFVTKIWENRQKIKIIKIVKDLKWAIIASFVLMLLAAYVSRNNTSPPLIILGAALPFIVVMVYGLFKKKK